MGEKESIMKRIEQEILETKIKIKKYKDLSRPISPENAIGRISRMDAINNKSITEAALLEAERKIIQLKYIKNKMDTPDFGICEKCKTKIPFQRIMLQPQSRYCVRCAN